MKMTFLPIKIIIIIESTKLFKESVEIKKVHYFIQTTKFFLEILDQNNPKGVWN